MNQTTIKRFQLYLGEVICYYHRYGTLRGFSVLASKHKTSKIPSEIFFQAGLDQMPMGSVPSMKTCLEILQNINRRLDLDFTAYEHLSVEEIEQKAQSFYEWAKQNLEI